MADWLMLVGRPRLPSAAPPVGASLHLLRLTGTLYCQAELSAPWGIDIPHLEGAIGFIVITAGRCLLEIADGESRWLEPGSLTLFPHGSPHTLKSGARVRAQPLSAIPVQHLSERYEVARYGGGGATTRAMYGVMRLEHGASERLMAQLPDVIFVDSWDEEAGAWLQSTLRWIAHEASSMRPGGEAVITRLADILVIQAMRSWMDRAPEAQRGWLAAVRDPRLGRALAGIHERSALDWTVAKLAEEAGMSRSAFSSRFAEAVGEPPLHYLTAFRMQLARARLRQSDESLSEIARGVGYRSDAAFCRAFKRAHGLSPGRARRETADVRAAGTPD